jgi:hypothetical protein
MLVHLDKNKLTFFDTNQKELYDFMIEVADHQLVERKKKQTNERERLHSDEKVAAVSKWIHARVRDVKKGEKLISYRELRRILESFGYYLENPHGNSIDIVRYEMVKKGLLLRREERVTNRVGNMSWPGEGHAAKCLRLSIYRFDSRCKVKQCSHLSLCGCTLMLCIYLTFTASS